MVIWQATINDCGGFGRCAAVCLPGSSKVLGNCILIDFLQLTDVIIKPKLKATVRQRRGVFAPKLD